MSPVHPKALAPPHQPYLDQSFSSLWIKYKSNLKSPSRPKISQVKNSPNIAGQIQITPLKQSIITYTALNMSNLANN